MKRDFVMSLFVPETLSVDDARVLIDILRSKSEQFAPVRHGRSEPLREDFDSDALPTMWSSRYLWESADGAVQGTVFLREFEHEPHSVVVLYSPRRLIDEEGVFRLFNAFAEAWRLDYAVAHVLTAHEMAYGHPQVVGYADVRGQEPLLTITSRVLQQYLPDLYWTNVFGAPYVELFGRNRLLETSAFKSVPLANDSIYLQLTEHLDDVSANHDRLAQIRQRIKNELGHEAFWDPDAA